MKNIVIVPLLYAASTGFICAGDEAKKATLSSPQQIITKNDAVIRWQEQSLTILSKQIMATNLWGTSIYVHRTAPQKNDTLGTKIIDKASLFLSEKKFAKAWKTEETTRRRIRTTWQHLDPKKETIRAKQRAKL